MAVSTTPHVCTLLWPFLGEQEGSEQEDSWLLGWNPRGLVIVVVAIVQSNAFEDALRVLDRIREHKVKENVEGRGSWRKDVSSLAPLSVLGRLRGLRAHSIVLGDEERVRSENWVRSERQRSDIWIELNKGPVLDQVWCCGYGVQPCHLHVIRTDPCGKYAKLPTVFSATARFGCDGIAELLQGRQPLCIPGVHSSLEGVLLPSHMVPLAGPCVSRRLEPESSALSRSFLRRATEDYSESNIPVDDILNNGSSSSRRDREKLDQQGFLLEPVDIEPVLTSPVNGLPPRLDFPTTADSAEMSRLLRSNNRGRALRKYLECCGGKVKSGGGNDGREKHNSDHCDSKEMETNGTKALEKQSFWEHYLYVSIGVLLSVLMIFIPVLTFLGRLFCTAALLEFRLRELIHWLALLQGRTHVCGLHPVLPHMIHEDPTFQRFCAVNFLIRLLVDGLLGTLGSLLLAVGGTALITKSGSFCRYFLYDVHMGYMEWFEGWPAGLKMNEDLNMTLCFFAKWVLQTSWDFVVDFNWVELVYKLLVYIAPFGASCAFALISDVSILVSLHVLLLFHAISVPYRVMRSVTGSLFLQLRGKKYNPLRHRTDTYDFEVDQMLMGTLLFTVTVFLFPTLAVYYFYFALARSFIWLVQEGLVSATHITLYLPVYPVIYWAMNRWKWPGGFAITTPKVTRVRYHANGAGSSPCTSITVEVTVVSKPLGLHIFLSDFLLVLKILSDRRPFRMLEVICQAQVWRNTNPLERLIPHLQKDCINAGICMRPASTVKTTTATTKAAAAAAATTDTISASFTNASFVAETATPTTNAPSPSVTSSRH
ncbi:hypothetical protein ECC02_001690 [Trypanosoma cruzi]|uniref:UDP-GlcNAc:PI a1-6 GlcNAc-transferase n=1 Tax=Trypanosoma cruzi TaxID=5693 RepID=A0A7J6YEU9_TRYCR|nr:hypothetical protein ECC02_001690 [Trypanosoma cruzi]